jgi:hypothetical protein
MNSRVLPILVGDYPGQLLGFITHAPKFLFRSSREILPVRIGALATLNYMVNDDELSGGLAIRM